MIRAFLENVQRKHGRTDRSNQAVYISVSPSGLIVVYKNREMPVPESFETMAHYDNAEAFAAEYLR